MGCVAQKLGTPVSIKPTPLTACCANIVQTVSQDLTIAMKNINTIILTGKVVCTLGSVTAPVEDAIVVAKMGTASYVGITNSAGEYSICIPNDPTAASYTIQAYKCCCNSNITDTCTC